VSADRLALKFSAAFVLSRVVLTPAELALGFRRHWIGRRETVDLALGKLKAGQPVSDTEEALAFLLSDDLDQVDDIIGRIEAESGTKEPDALRVWLYLALAWLWEHRIPISDSNAMLEAIYADFGYPAEIEHFAGYMAPPNGEPPSQASVDRRWSAYLGERAREFGARSRLA
jgi:hypothetical protein